MEHNSPAALLDLKDLRSSGEIPLPRPHSAAGLPPVLVLGGSADVIVDVPGLHETANLLNTEAVVLPGMAHDMMLVSSQSLRLPLLGHPHASHCAASEVCMPCSTPCSC